jgi:hypothetical protein
MQQTGYSTRGPASRGIAAVIVLVIALGWSAPLAAQTDATPAPPDTLPEIVIEKNFGRAFGEVVAVNLFVWSFNRFLREGGTNPGFRISGESWWNNIQNGFEWDDNNFSTNQFAHPFHGSLYYNAARSNGYNYWESIPFTFAGSFMWEYFGETHHPSINDWYSTAVGGIAMGESLYRLSSMVLDNEATGASRTWRELGALAMNPVRGVNRIVTGEAFKQHRNPPDRFPGNLSNTFDVGLRTVGDERLWESDTTNVFMQFEFDYGDPYEEPVRKPFDFFDFGFQLNFSDKETLGRLQTRGALFAADMFQSETSHHLVSVFHHFDYLNNRAFEFGAQSLGGTFLSKFEASRSELRTELHLNAILMGATKSDYLSISGREYDYGPGVGFKFKAALSRNNRDFFTLGHEQHWIHVMNGNRGDHLVTFSTARLEVPMVKNIAAGAEYILYLADRNYRDFENVYQRSPQFRLYFSWLLSQ